MRYIALLRGINVGGNTMVKMEELRSTFEALGFDNVKTYINSGNVGFDCRSPRVSKGLPSDAILCSIIEKAVGELAGNPIQVMVREQGEIQRIAANNPFDGKYQSHKEMHVLFLKSRLSIEQVSLLTEAAPAGEFFEIRGREIYCHLPMGVADSFLGHGLFEKKLKISVTARNWRTVDKLAEL